MGKKSKKQRKSISMVVAAALVGTNFVSTLIGIQPVYAVENSTIKEELASLNKVANGSFEDNYKSNKHDWVYKDGGRSAKAEEENNTYGKISEGTISESILQEISLTKTKKYKVSAKIRVNAPEGKTPSNVYFTAKRQTDDGKQGTVYNQIEFTKVTDGWVTSEFEFTADTDKAYVGIVKWAENDVDENVNKTEISIDDVKVIEEDVSTVIWEDDFTGTELNQDIWGYELGSIRGNEQQHYVDSKENVFLEDGNLVLKVTERDEEDHYMNPRNHATKREIIYNSGSVRTHGNKEFLYGRIEMRAKLPKGKGAFPAFWTLGADFTLDGDVNLKQGSSWPSTGEIDIMEIIGAPTEERAAQGEVAGGGTGTQSNRVSYGTPHFYYVNGDSDKDGSYSPEALGGNLTLDEDFYNDYHVFGINWSKDKIEWYVDGVVYNTMYLSGNDRLEAAAACFNRPQYIQFNLATGGNWAGNAGEYLEEDNTTFEIDWVRWSQNEEQKADAAEYYAENPTISGIKNLTMVQGETADLLEGITVDKANFDIDYSIDDEYMFNNDGGNTNVTLQVTGKADEAGLRGLAPGVYNIHYTAFPKGVKLDGWVTPTYKIKRETALLTVLPRGEAAIQGEAGQALSAVSLPDGWEWVNSNEVLSDEGVYKVRFNNIEAEEKAGTERTIITEVAGDKIISGKDTEVHDLVATSENMVLDGTKEKAVAASATLKEKLNEIVEIGSGTVTLRYSLKNENAITKSAILGLLSVSNNEAETEYASFFIRPATNKFGVEFRTEGKKGSVEVGSGFNYISNNDWQTVSYVFNGKNMTVYLNGDKVGTASLDGLFENLSWIERANNLTVGGLDRKYEGASAFQWAFKGNIDNIEIDNSILSADEIKDLHSETSRDYTGEKYALWDKFDEDIFEYRIPSIVKTPQGTLVAASDARKMHYNDWGDISTVVRVSNDDGKTWSENITVLDMATQPYFTKNYLYTDWNTGAVQSAFSIDPILMTDSKGKIYMLVDVFPESQGAVNSLAGSGYQEIDGKKYLTLSDFNNKTYTVRDDGYVYNSDNQKTNMYVDKGNFETAFSTKGDLYEKVTSGEDKYLGNIYLRSGRNVTGVTREGSKTAPLFVHLTSYLWLFTSDDQGQTWSEPVDITGSVKESWMEFIGTGAATGIELEVSENGKTFNRLMFPIYYTNQQGTGSLGRQSSANVYSDDGGITWHRGESPNDGRYYGNANKQTNSKDFNTAVTELTENQIVQLNNGHLLQFMRNTGTTIAIGRSTDYGKTWDDNVLVSDIPEPYVNLSVIHMNIGDKEYVVLSNPTGHPEADTQASRNMRMKGAIRVGEVQPDDSIKWVASKIYEPKRFAYSSLVQLDAEKVGVIYEYNGHIKYSTFNIKEMIESEERFDVTYIENVTKTVEDKKVTFTVKMNQNVFIVGSRTLDIKVNGVEETATYVSGSGSDTLVFEYTSTEAITGEILVANTFTGSTIESIYNIGITSATGYTIEANDNMFFLGNNISEMFNNKYSDNTWVFTGGSAVKGGYDQTKGVRNYVGQFEEYIRWTKSSNTEYGKQRYVINAGRDEATLADIVESFEDRVAAYSPKAVAYIIGEEDYSQGTEKISDFKVNLKTFMDKALALHNGNAFVVIQTPFATNDDNSNELIEAYIKATKEVIEPYSASRVIDNIVLVNHYELTNNEDFKNANLNEDNTLNATGHFEIGKQLSEATIKTIDGYVGRNIALNLENSEAANEALQVETLVVGEENQQLIKDKMNSGEGLTWLFMGDSITHGALWTNGYDSVHQAFEKFLNDDLGREDDIVVNTAVSGATVASTLAEIDQRLDKYSPDVVSIMLGTNDAANANLPLDTYKAGLQQIIDKAEAKGAIVILRTPLPTTYDSRSTRIPSFNEAMKQVAKENENVIFIDQYTGLNKLLTNNTALWNANNYVIADKLHPGANGQLILTKMFIKGCGLSKEGSKIENLAYKMAITTN